MNKLVSMVTGAVLLAASAGTAYSTICISDVPTLRQVRGIVVMAGEDGWLLPGATIRMTAGKLDREAVSDEDGYFRFTGLRTGNYELHASLEGFLSFAGRVNVRSKGAEEGQVLLIYMTPFLDDCGGIRLAPWREARDVQLRAKRRQEAARRGSDLW